MKFKISFIILFFCIAGTRAQSFKWQAKLEKVNANGFYNIALTPDLVSKTAAQDLADIRIYENLKEIPYLLRKESDSVKPKTPGSLQHYSLIPGATITVTALKPTKQSLVTINFNENYQVDKLVLHVAGFKFYRREAWLAEQNANFNNKRNRNTYNRLVDFIILSGKPTTIELNGTNRYKRLYLFIENEDNLPLEVKKMEAYQQNMHLTTYLEKDKTYTIKTGQQNIALPRYDLSYFSDSISNAVPFVKTEQFIQKTEKVKTTKTFFNNKAWIWAALGVLIAFIGYLSYHMISDMQRKKSQ